MHSSLSDSLRKQILIAQKNEITEHIIYSKLADVEKNPHNKKLLHKISEDELKHYTLFKKFTNQSVKPNGFKVWKYHWLAKIFGITFAIKLMEKGEEGAQGFYEQFISLTPDAKKVIADEAEHEMKLISMIDEERLKYVGSMVLGLNDALVELTGALAGLTFALQKTSLIAFAGLITGIAAALSMAASEYLSTKSEENGKNPVKASIYTGTLYMLTVFLLIAPYFIFSNVYVALGLTLFIVLTVIALFTFYISIAKDVSFKKRFFEMAAISVGVAAFTFIIGFIVRIFFNVEI